MRYKSVLVRLAVIVVFLCVIVVAAIGFKTSLEYTQKMRNGKTFDWPIENADSDQTGALTDAAVEKYSRRVLMEDGLLTQYSELQAINRKVSVAESAVVQKPVISQWKDSKSNSFVEVRLELQGDKVTGHRYFPK